MCKDWQLVKCSLLRFGISREMRGPVIWPSPVLVLVLVLVLILGTSHHQADACHLASVYLGFRSIWNTHFCLRLQPHLYPSLVETSLGRDVRPNSDISQRMSSPTPPSETRNYC